MKPGDLVQLFSNIDTKVWCLDQDDNSCFFLNGTSVVIIRRDEELQERRAIDLVLCDGKLVWVRRDQLEVVNESR